MKICSLLALLAPCAHGFKFMSNWKMPTLQGQMQKIATDEKFGDKKLVVITGTSSGLGRKTAAALLRTGKYHVVGAVRQTPQRAVPLRRLPALQGWFEARHVVLAAQHLAAQRYPRPRLSAHLQVRDLDKMEVVAEMDNFPSDCFRAMHCELNSFESVRLAPAHVIISRMPACSHGLSSSPSPQVRSFVKELEEFKLSKPVDRLICNAAVYQPSLPYAKWSVDGHEQQMQINFLSHFLLTSLLIDDLAK
jgi:NAD(P)-dependent dehydrogenase (short-subunit alcohol dehydrogenase family)